MWSKIVNEFLFWLHLLIILGGMVFSFLASPVLVLGLMTLHQAHLKIFRGCSLTMLQQKLGGLRRGAKFFDVAWARFVGRSPTALERGIFRHAQWAVPVLGVTVRWVW
jgi:hypothetical protein